MAISLNFILDVSEHMAIPESGVSIPLH